MEPHLLVVDLPSQHLRRHPVWGAHHSQRLLLAALAGGHGWTSGAAHSPLSLSNLPLSLWGSPNHHLYLPSWANPPPCSPQTHLSPSTPSLLCCLLASPKCVHLSHEFPSLGTTPTLSHLRPSSCIPNVHPSPGGLDTPYSKDGDGCCPRTCRWGSSPPSQSHPPQPCSHWPRSAPGSSRDTGAPVTPTSPALPGQTLLPGCPGTTQPPAPRLAVPRQQCGDGTRAMGCLGASCTLEVRSRWKMPLECR